MNTLEVEALVTFTYFNLVLPKVEHLCASCELRTKRQQCESVQFDPLLISMCITILVLDFSMSGVRPVWSPFLLGDKQEAKFGGVMGA